MRAIFSQIKSISISGGRMSEIKFVPGEMLTFKSNKSFGLNFEDKTPSVKVLEGETLYYDGELAHYQSRNGAEVQGRTPWLRGAIRMDWLTLIPSRPRKIKSTAESQLSNQAKTEQSIQTRRKLYDNLKGGNFDEYSKQMNAQVEKEEDRVVKNIGQKPKKETLKSEKLEVAGDQVEVKSKDENGAFVVTSSTAQPRNKKHNTKVSSAEDYGADSTIAMKGSKKQENTSANKKRKTFTVDATTPAVQEGATKEEVERAKGVINAQESQNATVVRKIRRGSMKVEETDGIKVTNQVGSGDKPISTRASVSSPDKKAINTKATVGKGSEPVADLAAQQEAVVVSKQIKKASSTSSDMTRDYLEKMPDDWGDLHWTKKEKFIKQQTDKGLLEFIMRVENIKVVKTACKTRLEEIEK